MYHDDVVNIPINLPQKDLDGIRPIKSGLSSRAQQKPCRQPMNVPIFYREDNQQVGTGFYNAYLTEKIDQYVLLVKASQDPGSEVIIYDLPKLIMMFSIFVEACKAFVTKKDKFDADNFISGVIYLFSKPTHKQKKHNVYRKLAYAAECTKLPTYIYLAVGNTWTYDSEQTDNFLRIHERHERRRH